MEPLITKGPGFAFFKRAAKPFGIHFDDKKDQFPAAVLPLLGNLEDYSRCAFDEMRIEAKPERLAAVKAETTALIQQNSVPPASAATLRG